MFKEIKLPKGSGIAIINKGKPISFDNLNTFIDEQTREYSNLGIMHGTQVGFFIRDPFRFLVSYISLWNLGATPMLLDSQVNISTVVPTLKRVEANYLLSDHDQNTFDDFSMVNSNFSLSLYVNRTQGNSILKNLYGDTNKGFVILFTSGSEAAPKAVTLKKTAILNNVHKVINYLGLSQKDSTLITLPLSYSYAMSQTLAHLIGGSRVVFESQCYLIDNIIHLIDKHRISNYAATPYFFQNLHSFIKGNRDSIQYFSSIKFFMNAGGYLTPTIIKNIVHELPHITFYNNYGQTEASPRLTYGKFLSNSDSYLGVGRPLPGVEIKIEFDKMSDTGEILYRSEDIMLGYYGTFDEALPEKWFKTGDTGKLINGELHIYGRKDSMIKVNGRKVHINRIEDIIYDLGGIKHVNLSKQQHPMYGEYLIATITPKNSDITEGDFKKSIWNFIKKNLSPYERPQKILINKDVMLSSNGKIIKDFKRGGLS